jgi:hypothetical protein
VEYWVLTHNLRPHKNEWLNLPSTPHELVTGQTPDISRSCLFPFGCPVSSIPPAPKDWKYAPTGEYGIAVGSSPHNGATLVYTPGRGTKPRERFDVTLLRVPYLPTPLNLQQILSFPLTPITPPPPTPVPPLHLPLAHWEHQYSPTPPTPLHLPSPRRQTFHCPNPL